MEPKSQAQSVVDQLASRIGVLEIEKAVALAELETVRQTCSTLTQENMRLFEESVKTKNKS